MLCRMRGNSNPSLRPGPPVLHHDAAGHIHKARRTGAGLVALAKAGAIASSIGSPIATPIPLTNVRRGRCFPVAIIRLDPLFSFETAHWTRSRSPESRTGSSPQPVERLSVLQSACRSARVRDLTRKSELLCHAFCEPFRSSFNMAFSSTGPLNDLPSGSVPEASIGNFPSWVRQAPMASKFSKPNPNGSIRA